ncbi:Putative methyltransferase [Nesidiocoris tenuis]|uniref:Methyltransferase n=1 Tax=Nesidiocoris tenuis TaxID=355587 RepID=A0ABN7AI59_9HEMI|nr:Putative methyltransferase [Nesidiocoris tenuis]
MDDEERLTNREEVKSELYEERSFRAVTTLDNSNCLVNFTIRLDDPLACDTFQTDEDGDIVPPRLSHHSLTIEFSRSTVIPLVGLQLWRGALLLADYILTHRDEFENKNVLELAAGVGFTSIVAGTIAKRVTCTDISTGGILELIQRNLDRNRNLVKASSFVLEFDFYADEWSTSLEQNVKQAEIILAADVIYDNELSEVFVRCLTKIFKIAPKKTLYLALEKRYVFALEDLDTVAPCYEHFFKYLRSFWTQPPMCNWKIEPVEIDFPQRIEYERTIHLVLWRFST